MDSKHFESLYPETTREQEISRVVEAIREGGSSQLIGIPGVGRSNILRLLLHNKEVRLKHFPKHHTSMHFVYLNFVEVRNRPFVDILKFIHLAILSSLQEREMKKHYEFADKVFKDALATGDQMVLSQSLVRVIEYISVDQKLTAIFLCDKFDNYVPTISEKFFILLRSLRDIAKYRFSAVFSVERPLDQVIDPKLYHEFSDFLSGHEVYVRMYDPTTIDFRISYLEKLTGKKISKEHKDTIIQLTGGHIRLTKLAIEAVFANDPQVIDQDFLLKQKTIQAALHDIWDALLPEEQDSIRKESFNDEYLINTGLVDGNKFSLPLLLMQKDLLDSMHKEIVLDEDSGRILEGDNIISDSLTKSEYKLLKYLLQNKDQVIDRDQIVENVWSENKSVTGVTEQAIDQLISRLRKKVEKDPNNPIHILTIKGRGVKFS